MKSHHITQTALFITLFALAACGGDSGGDEAPEQPSLFFGSTDPDAAANGLPYAKEGDNVVALLNQDINVRVVRTNLDSAGNDDVVKLDDGILRLEGDPENLTLLLTVDGETVIAGSGLAQDGETITTGEIQAGAFSGAAIVLNSEISDPESSDETLTSVQFASFGFETNPETIETLSGSADYSTNLVGFVVQANEAEAQDIFVDGTLTFTADFSDSSVTGKGILTIFDGDNPGMLIDLDKAAIVGNGFTTGSRATECLGASACSSDSEIGAVFYGPNAEELGGIATLDLSFTDPDGQTTDYVGGGVFGPTNSSE